MSRQADRCSLRQEERREVPDLFLRTNLAQAAAGEPAADGERQRAEFAGEERRQSDAGADERAGVRTGDEAGEKRARTASGPPRRSGGAAARRRRRRAGCRTRRRRLQPLRPVAPFGEQNAPETVEPHQHRRENGGDGDVRHQGDGNLRDRGASCGIRAVNYNIVRTYRRSFQRFHVPRSRSGSGSSKRQRGRETGTRTDVHELHPEPSAGMCLL